MNRKSLVAIAAFAVLGLVAVVSLRQPEKGEGDADRQRPLAKIAADDLDTIQILSGGVTTTLKRQGGSGGKITVTTPVAYPADEGNAKGAFEQIEKLALGDLVTENKARHAEFQVDDAKAIHVIAKSDKAGKVLADLLVGKVVGSGTMVRVVGKDEVWQAGGGIRGAFEHPTADWRDRSITTFAQADAEMLTVKTKDGSTVIVKKAAGGDDKFDLVTSVPKLAATDKLDNTVPFGVLSGLSAWKANDFADGAAASVTGFDAPAMTLTVALKGGKNVTALVGNKKSDDELYVKRADAPQVFVVKKANLERIYKRPVEYKDKTVCDLAEADLAEVAVTNGADSYTLLNEGGKWKAAKFELDPSRTPSIGGGFKDWKGNGIAEEAPAAVGLAKPKATIVAKSKSKPAAGVSCVIKLGDESKDKQYVYAQTAKSADVYLLPKWSVDRILVKVADLKKK
jgi:hypothetical protein